MNEHEDEKWWRTGRRARRAYRHNHAWINGGHALPSPERSRCQRLTNEQRRNNRKFRAHEARKQKRRERRQATEAAA